MTDNSHGTAGGEAQRKYEKLRDEINAAREEQKRTMSFWARIFSPGDKRIDKAQAWKKGASGESGIGAELDHLAAEEGFVVLHDRRIHESSGNIDHILVTPFGVFVVDAKNYKGVIKVREGERWNSPSTLYINNWKQTRLVDAVKRQVDRVNKALAKKEIEAPVFGMLAFYSGDFAEYFGPTQVDGILINPRGIKRTIMKQKRNPTCDVKVISEFLKLEFPPK